MADEQQRLIGPHPIQQFEHLARLHTARELRVQLQQLALGLARLLERQLGGFARTRLRTREDRAELDAHTGESRTRNARLALPALGQLALRVSTRAVRLCVGMTEQPKLTSHSHGVLRA
jgi:hypothetical protein